MRWENQKTLWHMSTSGWTCPFSFFFFLAYLVVLINSITAFLAFLEFAKSIVSLSGNCQRVRVVLSDIKGMKFCIYKSFLGALFLGLQHFSSAVLKSFSLIVFWDTVPCYRAFIWQITAFIQSRIRQRVVKKKSMGYCWCVYSYVFFRSFNFLSIVCNFSLKQHLLFFCIYLYGLFWL